ncbi:MAG: hypothetical protein RL385_2304, partial [Pseudomonadota bacterium]
TMTFTGTASGDVSKVSGMQVAFLDTTPVLVEALTRVGTSNQWSKSRTMGGVGNNRPYEIRATSTAGGSTTARGTYTVVAAGLSVAASANPASVHQYENITFTGTVSGNAALVSKAELIAPDSAYNYGDSMQQVGRACLSEQFIQDHAFTTVADGCAAPPSGTAVIDENFETGDFAVGTGGARTFGAFTDRAAAGVTVSIEQGTGAGETRALKILGARMETDDRNRVIGTSDSGVFATFAKFEPKYVSFRVKVGVETATALRSPSHARGTFALASEADKGSGNGGHPRLLGTTTINDYLGTLNADASSYPAGLGGKWAHVEMRNFDWTRRRFDYYVDCKRVAQHVDIPAGYGSGADILDLFNYADSTAVATSPHTVAWFDDIIVK